MHTTPRTLFPALFTGLSIALFLFGGSADATIHRVDCTGATGLPTIQDGVDVCEPGDTVLVLSCPLGPYDPFVMDAKDRCHVVGAEVGVDTGSDDVGVGSAASLSPLATVSGSADCAVVTGSTSCSITNLAMTSCGGNGVVIKDSFDTVIADNRITNIELNGVFDSFSTDTQITGNVIGLNPEHGVFVEAARAPIITDNLIGFNGGAGVFMPAPDNFNVHISNNAILSNSAECIVDAGEENRIERNGCTNNCASGICADEILLSGGSALADVVGNDCAGGTILDLGAGTELDENSCP